MKVDKVVKKETINMGLGILVCSAVTQIIFLIFRAYSLAVLLGSIYGGAMVLANFFLMGITVQNVTKLDDENLAKKRIQFSYSMRQLGLILLLGMGMYIAVNFQIFHWLPILLAVVYPRLIILFLGLFRK